MENLIFKPQGEANFYFVHQEQNPNNWLMNVQFNGELTTQQQIEIMEKITAIPKLINALTLMNDYYIGGKPLTDLELEDLNNLAINTIKKHD